MRTVTAEDYDAAARLFDANLATKLKNGAIQPQWISSSRFTYRRDTASGWEFVVFDAQTGGRQPAFDHAAFAQALAAEAGDVAISADRLPIGRLTVDPSGWKVTLDLAARPGLTARGDDAQWVFRGEAEPLWVASPDGRFGLGCEGPDFIAIDLGTDRFRRLTVDGEPWFAYGKPLDSTLRSIPRRRAGVTEAPSGVVWSTEGAAFAGERVDERSLRDYPFVDLAPHDGSFAPALFNLRHRLALDPSPPAELFAGDAARGVLHRHALPEGWRVDEAALGWSPGNRSVYSLVSSPGARSVRLLEMDLETGAVRTVFEESCATRYLPNQFIYNAPNIRILAASDELIWFSQQDGWGHLYLHDLKTGALKRRLTQGPWLVRDVIAVDQVRRRIFFTAAGREPGSDPYFRRLYRLDLDGGDPLLLTPEDAEHTINGPVPAFFAEYFGLPREAVALSPLCEWFIDNISTVDQEPVTVLRSVEDGRVIAEIERADASLVYAAGWRPPTREVVKAADGETDIYAVVYRPFGLAAGETRPVVDATYGGPQILSAPRSFAEAVAALTPGGRSSLARLGFAVVTIDGRGTPGRSQAFHDVGYGDFAGPQIADHVAALEQLAARHRYFDLERVGAYGHSFGGYVTARMILSRPDVYKAVVSSGGSHNYHAFYGGFERFIGLPTDADGGPWRGGPNEAPPNWKALDNAELAPNLRGHLMLAYGDLDENAFPAVTVQLVDALIAADKDFDLVMLPGRDHNFARTDQYFIRRLWDFLVRHLAGQEPPPPAPLQIGAPPSARGL